MRFQRPTGMTAFLLLAIGQFISLTGTAMTAFALGIWMVERSGDATSYALLAFFGGLAVFFTPFIGVLVDRWDRKLTMMLSDLGTGMMTITLFILYNADAMQTWHLYAAAFITSIFSMFQWPAYSAAISVMVPKEQYGRAGALQGLAESGSSIIAPALAAVLLGGLIVGGLNLVPAIGLGGIMTIDLLTFAAAFGALLFIRVPPTPTSSTGAAAAGSFWQEALYGFRYIRQRPGLVGLQLIAMAGNFTSTIGIALATPMILIRSGGDEPTLGLVQAMYGVGGVISGLLLAAWKGPRRWIWGVVGGWMLIGLGGTALMGLGSGVVVWMVAAFIYAFMIPVIATSGQVIWQAKVPPDVQGRVFSARRFISWGVNPLAAFLAGPLADRVLEPTMQPGGALAGIFGGLIGTGPGAGISLTILLAGLIGAACALAGFLTPTVREIEDQLPDHDQPTASANLQT